MRKRLDQLQFAFIDKLKRESNLNNLNRNIPNLNTLFFIILMYIIIIAMHLPPHQSDAHHWPIYDIGCGQDLIAAAREIRSHCALLRAHWQTRSVVYLRCRRNRKGKHDQAGQLPEQLYGAAARSAGHARSPAKH